MGLAEAEGSTPPAEPRTAAGLWPKLALLAVSFAFAFAVAEAVLRTWPPPFYSDPLREYHPDLGWTTQPGQVFYRRRGTSLVRFATNSLGFRDLEHSLGGSAATLVPARRIRRIVVIGDSFSEAAQVELPLTFWSRLKVRLNTGKKVYWEVVNLGMSGYGTLQEVLALERFGMAYRPDLVILQVFPLNDIVNNSVAAANVTNSQDAYRPYLDPGTDFSTITYLNPKTSWLRRRSAVFRNVFLAAQKAFGPWGREMLFPDRRSLLAHVETVNAELGWPTGLDLPDEPILFNTFAAEKDQLEMIRQGWAATEAAIDRVHETVVGGGARLMVMVVPHPHQLKHRFPKRQENLPYVADPRYAETRLRRHLGDRAASFVELVDLFEANLPVVLPYVDGHLRVSAHQLVADVLAAEVARLFPNRFHRSVAAKLREKAELRHQGPAPETALQTQP